MPVLETKSLDADREGLSLLAAILHPTRAQRVSALANGRRRAKLGFLPAASLIEARRTDGGTDTLSPTPLSAG